MNAQLPKPNQLVLLKIKTSKIETAWILAVYVRQYEREHRFDVDECDSEYSEDDDCYFWLPGWYEQSYCVNGDELRYYFVNNQAVEWVAIPGEG